MVGSCAIDRIEQHGRRSAQLGGTATYAALTYARLGAAVRVVTRVAPEDGAILDPLRLAGVDVRATPSARTTRFVNAIDGDGRQQRLLAIAAPIDGESVTDACRGAALVHLGPLHPADLSPAQGSLDRRYHRRYC